MVMLPLLLGLMVATLSPYASAQRGGCVLHYEDGALVEASAWTQVVNLAEGSHAYTPLPDISPADHAYYTFVDTSNIKDVAIDSTNAKYFQVELTTNTLVIKTGEQFPVFEKVTSIISKTFQLELTVTCGDADGVNEANSLLVLVRVHDSNNYAPQPESDRYVFRAAVPLPAGTDLTKEQPIAARDYDVTSNGLFAEVVGGDGAFTATATKSGSERGSYAVTLLTAAPIRDTRPIDFQIRIQDFGTSDDSQVQQEYVSVTFEPDLDTSMVAPRFEEPLYSFQVESAAAGTPLGPPLQLTEGAAATLQLRDAFLPDGEARASELLEAELLEAEGGGGGGGVQLRWREDADEEAVAALLSRRYALLVLTANDADPTLTGSTVIHLVLPGPEPDPTTTPEPCPTTVADTTTECPVCPDTTTAESCPSTGTDATTECPICPETTTAESCPICPDTTTAIDLCPSAGTDATTECPSCPETTTAESCPICPDTTTATDLCPTTGTDATTECPSCPETTTAESCPICPETTTAADPCPTTGTDASTVCPICPDTTTAADPCPSTGSDENTECPICPDTSTAPPSCPDTSTGTDCSCEPCSSTTECPATNCPPTESPGASTQEPEPAVRLAFEREWYSVHVPADAAEGQELVWPRLTDATAATPGVVFSIDKGASSSPSALVRMDKDTGRVTLGLSPPLAGSYLYTLRASAPAAAPALAELVVTGPPAAGGGACAEGDWCFGAALTVVRVTESETTQSVLPASADAGRGCRFTLADAATDLLSVDAATGEVTAQPLDREDEAWACADEPVLRLQLHVSCASAAPNAAANASSARADADTCSAADWEAALGPSVASDGASTLALVLLQDANDNAPSFDPPRLTLGLPDARAARLLRPAAIFVAQAVDVDAGINAALRYSLSGEGARLVTVHEDTGALYLRAAPATAEEAEAEVLATDRRGRPGDPGTNTGRLALTLVALSAGQLAEVRVRRELPERAGDVLSSAQAQAEGEGLQLRALSTAFLPADRRTRTDDDDGDEEGELRLVVYALRDGRPLPADDFQDWLQSALENAGFPGAAVAPADLGGGDGDGGGGGSDAGLVAAVVVLAVLLCLLAAAGGVAAFLVRRRFFGAKEEEEQPWPKGGKGDAMGDASDSSLRSVVANIEPLTEDLIKTRLHTTDSSPSLLPEGPAVGQLLPLELEAPASGLQLWRDGDGESSLEENTTAPPADLEEAPSDGPSARKVVFNEDVDCIELRM